DDLCLRLLCWFLKVKMMVIDSVILKSTLENKRCPVHINIILLKSKFLNKNVQQHPKTSQQDFLFCWIILFWLTSLNNLGRYGTSLDKPKKENTRVCQSDLRK